MTISELGLKTGKNRIPYNQFETFDACVDYQIGIGHNDDVTSKICNYLFTLDDMTEKEVEK